MMRSEGIVIREMRYLDSSKILTVFTRDYGKISVLARGVVRPKSQNTNSSVLFSRSEFNFVHGRNFFYLSSSNVIHLNYALRTDHLKFLYASYFSELLNESVPLEDTNIPLYGMFVKALELLDHSSQGIFSLILAFQIKLIAMSGYRPELKSCVSCGNSFSERWKFSLEESGLLCERCFPIDPYAIGIPLSVMKYAYEFLYMSFEDAMKIKVSMAQFETLFSVLNRYLLHILDLRAFKTELQIRRFSDLGFHC